MKTAQTINILAKIPISIKEAIGNVNKSLKSYEAEYVSLKRSPWSEKERIHTLRQFLECRLNMEFLDIPEIADAIMGFDDHFLEVISVVGGDEEKKRFQYAIACINKSPNQYFGDMNFTEVISKVESFIGGSKIQFNNSPKRPKIKISK